jgi:quercetin dioxygenase-like cupin family protein
MKSNNQDYFISPPFPLSGESAWYPCWYELKAAGYELHSEVEILDNASYPDDPDSCGTTYFIKKGDFAGSFKEAVVHYFGEAEAKEMFSEWQVSTDLITLKKRLFLNLRQETESRWDQGKFLDHPGCPFVVRAQEYPHLDWEEYESYMQAQLLRAIPGEIGVLLVKFPPEASEDNRLHTHPASDRVITVVAGSGEFIRYWGGKVEYFPIQKGDRIWMPKGVLHTFRSGEEGLLVESLHNPFVSFGDPNCLLYPKKSIEV